MAINNFTDGELLTAPRMNEMVGQLNTRYYTIDQTAGRVVKVWDYLNNREQMVYGDTGWRTLPVTGGQAGALRIRRTDATVTLAFSNVRNAASGTVLIGEAPLGFRPFQTVPGMVQDSNSMRVAQALSYAPYSIQVLGVGLANSYLTGVISWPTNETWPTTLPGSADGGVPL